MRGTTPEGTHSEQEAARWVRGMFGGIAHRYDLLNHLLSWNLDRHWRAHTVRRVTPALQRQDARVLDVCCGTGDLLLALTKARGAPVLGSDFCHPMLTAAREKIARRRAPAAVFESDALRLPIRDGSLDLLTVAFGFRNLVNYEAGLKEIRRVLRQGGTAAILEFSQPTNRAFAATYYWYSRHILPRIGAALSGSREAYAYLPESVRKFPNAPDLADQMRAAGFAEVSYEYLTGGSVALHLGKT
jgi:demethylmenaquinone methyltransferase/2-methoxy-6-polyprenyl-1,4-benzoquinol methylase